MLNRAVFVVGALFLTTALPLAAENCPVPPHAAKATTKIGDWFDNYIRPFRVFAGIAEEPRLTDEQMEALANGMQAFHHSIVADSLLFEGFVRQISASYSRAADFRGINTAEAEKIYSGGSGAGLPFSAMCVDSRTIDATDDSFGITIFGVNNGDCQRWGMRGLVFTDTLINGAKQRQCRPDDVYLKNWFFPVTLGTNTITFICGKDINGCSRR